MSDWDDTDGVLHRFRLTDADDRQLAGGRGDDAPVGVAALLAALREPGRIDELAGTEELLAQMTDVITSAPGEAADHVAGRPVLRLVTGKIAAIAAVTLFSAGAAAAATGTLPDPIQQRVANTFAHVGIELDHPAGQPSPPTTTSASTTTTDSTTTTASTTTSSPPAVITAVPAPLAPAGPDPAAASGLCTAYQAGEANGHRLDSVAMRQLADAAAAEQQTVDEYCTQVSGTTVPETGTTGSEHERPEEPGNSGRTPSVTAPGRSTDHGQPTAPGQPADTGHGGSQPAVTAPGAPEDSGKPADSGSGSGNSTATGSSSSGPGIAAPVSTQTAPPQSTPSSGDHGKP